MGAGGLDDTVSPVFWVSPSFNLVDAEDREIPAVRIIVNPTDCVPGGGRRRSVRTRPRRPGRGCRHRRGVRAGRDPGILGGRHRHVSPSGYAGPGRRKAVPEPCRRYRAGCRARDRADGLRDPDLRPPAAGGRGAAVAPVTRWGSPYPPARSRPSSSAGAPRGHRFCTPSRRLRRSRSRAGVSAGSGCRFPAPG